MCSDLLTGKIYSWRQFYSQLCSKNFVKCAEKYPWQSLLLRNLQHVNYKYNFLGIYKIFNITVNILSTNLISMSNNKFWFFKFRYRQYSFFGSYEIVDGNSVIQQLKYTCLQVWSYNWIWTCTTYGKYLSESIMAVLTLKPGIWKTSFGLSILELLKIINVLKPRQFGI